MTIMNTHFRKNNKHNKITYREIGTAQATPAYPPDRYAELDLVLTNQLWKMQSKMYKAKSAVTSLATTT